LIDKVKVYLKILFVKRITLVIMGLIEKFLTLFPC
jgi:hypothetical protein